MSTWRTFPPLHGIHRAMSWGVVTITRQPLALSGTGSVECLPFLAAYRQSNSPDPPLGLTKNLLQRTTGHRAAPHHRCFVGNHKAHGHRF